MSCSGSRANAAFSDLSSDRSEPSLSPIDALLTCAQAIDLAGNSVIARWCAMFVCSPLEGDECSAVLSTGDGRTVNDVLSYGLAQADLCTRLLFALEPIVSSQGDQRPCRREIVIAPVVRMAAFAVKATAGRRSDLTAAEAPIRLPGCRS